MWPSDRLSIVRSWRENKKIPYDNHESRHMRVMYMIEKNQTPMLSGGLGIPPDAIRSYKGSSISPPATPGCTPHHIFSSPVSYVPSQAHSYPWFGSAPAPMISVVWLSPLIVALLLPVLCGVISSSSVLDTFDGVGIHRWGTSIALPPLWVLLAANEGMMSGFCRNNNASHSEGMSLSLPSPSHCVRILARLLSSLQSLRDMLRLTFFGLISVYDRVCDYN